MATMGATGVEATVDQLVDRARRRAALDDFGAATWQEGLSIIVDSLENTPGVLPQGRDRLYGEAVDALCNRLRVIDYSKRHPAVRRERIERPLFILGLPRTGTTMASCLLAEDPARRSLLNWEAADSVPPATAATLRSDPRCITKQATLDALLVQLKAMQVPLVHWEDAGSPTECVFVHNQDFKALLWETSMPTRAYHDWLLSTDMTSAYSYEEQVLQVLQSEAPGIWSLKMPSHAIFIDALLNVFPDARLIWSHRDPYKATGSYLRLFQMAQGGILGADIDMAGMKARALEQLRAHVDNAAAARRRIGSDRFFDLHYADVMRDPLGRMRALYGWAGDDFTPEAEAAMTRWIADHPQDRHGSSPYSLEAYGITKRELEPIFEDYIAEYGIEPEGF